MPVYSPSSPSSQVIVDGYDTSSMSAGLFAYVSGAIVAKPTDALNLSSSIAVGVYDSASGQLVEQGSVDVAVTTFGGQPSNGSPLFLALASADGGVSSAGKVTGSPPSGSGQWVAPVAECKDNSNYASAGTVRAEIDRKSRIGL